MSLKNQRVMCLYGWFCRWGFFFFRLFCSVCWCHHFWPSGSGETHIRSQRWKVSLRFLCILNFLYISTCPGNIFPKESVYWSWTARLPWCSQLVDKLAGGEATKCLGNTGCGWWRDHQRVQELIQVLHRSCPLWSFLKLLNRDRFWKVP